jgi:hypothetical protein
MKHKLKRLIHTIQVWIKMHRRESIAIGVVVILLLVFGVSTLGGSNELGEVARTDPVTEAAPEPEPKPVTVASPLSGLQVSEEEAARPVTAAVIENSPDARPQDSLHEAGFVFEAIAEGGITRYVAFYQENRPDPIGPVRSLRPYFTDWILTFDASLAHVGGSSAALGEVGALGVKSLTQFTYGDSYYRTTDRFAPHNVYTDFDRLDALNKRLGYTSSDFDSFPRKTPKALATPKASEIVVDISSITYQSSYTYNKSGNKYLRKVAGSPEVDRESGKRIAPSVVVIVEVPFSIGNNGRYDYDLVGSGKVTVFQDGNVQVGTWKKTARSAQMTFTADNGNEIKLNPGQVWMTAISPSQEVTYTP